MTKYPELFRVREDGRPLTFGNRREYCPNNPMYHDYTWRIVTRMAEHFADHPSVIGWQIDNEFGDRCYCSVCTRGFQNWLHSHYGTLENLNERWGTIFWSHVYNDWSEIPVPLSTGISPNPGLALDFYRFSSDSYVDYQKLQIEILRRNCPQHFITHNFMGFKYDRLNYYDLAQGLNFITWDNYPRTQWNMQAEVDPSRIALGHDTMRGLKRQNFWVMEQQAGPGGWESVSVMPRPGELRLWAYQSIARGADGIVFFRWRTARFGTEEYWHGLLDHDATPSRRYQEIKRMGAEIRKAGDEILGSQLKPEVALLLSYDSRFAFQIQPNNPRFSYPDHFHQVYQGFFNRQVMTDVLSPTDDLSTYKLVIAPALHIVDQAILNTLEKFVKDGGTLLLTSRSGVKDESNTVVNQRLPGLLRELCGIEVEDYDSLGPEMQNEVKFELPELAPMPAYPVSQWCDILKPVGATVVARYTQDYYAGKPSITMNTFGKGRVVYIGAVAGLELYETMAGWLLDLVGVKPLMYVPKGVEVTERWQGDWRLIFVLNHSNSEQSIRLDGQYINLIDRKIALKNKVTIAPKEVLVLSQERRG